MSTNKRKEKISAFLDNEIFRDELMSFSLSSEPEDAEVIQRYQMMGDCLRGEMSESSFVDVSQAVHEALLDENLAIDNLAVDNHVVEGPAEPAGMEPTSRRANSKIGAFTLSAWFRPVAGMAVAASVALVMIVTLSGQENATPIAKNIEQQPAVIPAIQLAIENKSVDKKATDLDPHLVNQHLEFATQDTLQGRLPFVRAVSYQNKNSNNNKQLK